MLLNRFSKPRNVFIIVLVAFTLLIILPPISYNYVYPNTGDDTAAHIRVIESLQTHEGYYPPSYMAQVLLGNVLNWFCDLTGISLSMIFLWINYGVLLITGYIIALLLYFVVNWQAGIVAIPIVLLVSPSLLNLFDAGAIYNIAVIGVGFPLFILLLINASKKRWWLLLGAILVAVITIWFYISSVFNTSPFIEKVRPSLSSIVSIAGIVTIVLGIIGLVLYKKPQSNRICLFLIMMCVFLAIGFILVQRGFSWTYRLTMNSAVIFAILTAGLIGLALARKHLFANIVIISLVVVTSLPVIYDYTQYKSAVYPADKLAFKYVNQMQGDTFACSSEVAPWIYEVYLDKSYDSTSAIYIQRNIPMTWRTNPESPYFWGYKSMPAGSESVASFVDNKVKVIVWELQ